MAKISIDTLKTKFETGDRPDGQDYQDLIDTLASQATDLGTSGNNEHIIYGIENFTVIDSFVANEWRMVKYLVSISKTSEADNKFFPLAKYSWGSLSVDFGIFRAQGVPDSGCHTVRPDSEGTPNALFRDAYLATYLTSDLVAISGLCEIRTGQYQELKRELTSVLAARPR
jgi:hypothetical protein